MRWGGGGGLQVERYESSSRARWGRLKGEAGITKAKCNGADRSQHVLYSNPVALRPTHPHLDTQLQHTDKARIAGTYQIGLLGPKTDRSMGKRFTHMGNMPI